MDYRNYATQYFLCILGIELMQEKMVSAPKNGPIWLMELINYLFSEYANSRDGLYAIGQAFSLSDDFASLKSRLLSIDLPEFEEANDKCKWKEK